MYSQFSRLNPYQPDACTSPFGADANATRSTTTPYPVPAYSSARPTSTAYPCASATSKTPLLDAPATLSGLVLDLRAENFATGTWTDVSSAAHSFTLFDSINPKKLATQTPSGLSAMVFAGTGDGLAATGWDWSTSEFTMCMTFKLSAMSPYDHIIGDIGNAAANAGAWFVGLDASGTMLAVGLGQGSTVTTSMIHTGLSISTGGWHVLCVWGGGRQKSTGSTQGSYPGLTQVINIGVSLDGVSSAQSIMLTGIITYSNIYIGYLSTYTTGGKGQFRGSIQQIMMYNRMLSAGERDSAVYYLSTRTGIASSMTYATINPNSQYRFSQWTIAPTAAFAATVAGIPYIYHPEPVFAGGVYYVFASAWNSTTTACSGLGYIAQLNGTSPSSFVAASTPLSAKGQIAAALLPTPGSWDSVAVTSPSILFDGGIYYMYYAGGNTAGATCSSASLTASFRIGVATSTTLSGPWTKYGIVLDKSTSPTGTFEESTFLRPCVIKRGDLYYMFYRGTSASAVDSTGYAWSHSPYGPFIRSGRGSVLSPTTTAAAGTDAYADASMIAGTQVVPNLNQYLAITSHKNVLSSVAASTALVAVDFNYWVKVPVFLHGSNQMWGMQPRFVDRVNLTSLLLSDGGGALWYATLDSFQLPVCTFA
jgi:hypothetical protein